MIFSPFLKRHRCCLYSIGRVRLSHNSKYEKKKFPFFKTFGAITVLTTGGVLLYAYYDHERRKQLEKLPYLKDIFDYMIGNNEEKDKKGIIFKYPQQINEKFLEKWSEIKDNIVHQKEVVEKKTDSILDSIINKFKPNSVSVSSDSDKDAISNSHHGDFDKHKFDKIPLISKKQDFNNENKELENSQINMDEKVSFAIVSSNELIRYINEQAYLLKELMENANLQVDEENNIWKKLIEVQEKKNDRLKMKDKAHDAAKNDIAVMEALIIKLKDKDDKNDESKYGQYKTTFDDTMKKLNASNLSLHEAESKARVFLNYKWLLDDAKSQFKKELESISPHSKLGTWTLLGTDFSKDELDTLLVHAHKKINLIQKELAKVKAQNIEKLDKALRDQENTLKERFNGELTSALQDEKENWDKSRQPELDNLKSQYEIKLESDLAKEIASYREQMSTYLVRQREELMKISEAQMQETLKREESKSEQERTHVLSQITDVEKMFKDTLSFRFDFVKMQRFWLMCQSLLRSIESDRRSDDTDAENDGAIDPLATLQSFSKFPSLLPPTEHDDEGSEERELLQTLLKSLADSTSGSNDNGSSPFAKAFQTFEGLAHRFVRVKAMCRRVAMIRDPDASLFRYLVSYLQSIFVTESSPRIIQTNGDTKGSVVDFGDSCDTFDILALATYYLCEKRDLESTVRVMNLLSGQPQVIASGWLKDAITYLEVRQNLEVLASLAMVHTLTSLSKATTPYESGSSRYRHQN